MEDRTSLDLAKALLKVGLVSTQAKAMHYSKKLQELGVDIVWAETPQSEEGEGITESAVASDEFDAQDIA